MTHIDKNFVIVDIGGMGYKVHAPMDTIAILESKKKEVIMWTHLAVRENALDLYGFLTKHDLDFFEKIISISGIGPKKAINILSVASFETIRRAVSAGDASSLQKISGIGKKNAEKLVVELRDKIDKSEESDAVLKDEIDTIEALKALGYSFKDAKEALGRVSKSAKSTNEKIREALRILAQT